MTKFLIYTCLTIDIGFNHEKSCNVFSWFHIITKNVGGFFPNLSTSDVLFEGMIIISTIYGRLGIFIYLAVISAFSRYKTAENDPVNTKLLSYHFYFTP